MARASSVISVAITGDSKKLQGALRGADKGVAGFGSSMKKAALGIGSALAGIFAVSKAFDFVQGALQEADRLGDAMSNLNRIIGKTNTKKLQGTANAFIDLGLSSQEVLELSVAFARIGRTIGISPHIIGRYADDVAAVAQSLSLVDENGRGAAEWVAIISKVAAKPTLKSAKDLGLSLQAIEKATIKLAVQETGKLPKDLSDADKAAARLKVILQKLKPIIEDTLANPDVELKQKVLGAKIEELQGQLGTGLQPIVADILQNILDISKSEWVDDMVKGIEVLQGKHDVPIFEDLKTGIATVQAALDVVNEEGSADIKELQDAFTVQLPAGIDVAAKAVKPLVDALDGIGKASIDVQNDIASLLGKIFSFVTDAKSVLGPLASLINDIFAGDHTARFTVVAPGQRTGRGSPGSGGQTDAQISASLRRQRERNGLG